MTIENINPVNVAKINTPAEPARKYTLQDAFDEAVRESDILKSVPDKMKKNIIAAAQYVVLTKLES